MRNILFALLVFPLASCHQLMMTPQDEQPVVVRSKIQFENLEYKDDVDTIRISGVPIKILQLSESTNYNYRANTDDVGYANAFHDSDVLLPNSETLKVYIDTRDISFGDITKILVNAYSWPIDSKDYGSEHWRVWETSAKGHVRLYYHEFANIIIEFSP